VDLKSEILNLVAGRPFEDEKGNEVVRKELQPDYLLGRKTFEIWEGYWPDHADFWPGINEGTKFVFSKTRNRSDWKNSEFIENVDAIKQLKNSEGLDLQVWGSSKLIHLLLQHDLVDELRIKTYPVILGGGKKLFDSGEMPASFKLTESVVTTTGVIIAAYKREGDVKTGTAGECCNI
jgi:dihydrofolate reductase